MLRALFFVHRLSNKKAFTTGDTGFHGGNPLGRFALSLRHGFLAAEAATVF